MWVSIYERGRRVQRIPAQFASLAFQLGKPVVQTRDRDCTTDIDSPELNSPQQSAMDKLKDSQGVDAKADICKGKYFRVSPFPPISVALLSLHFLRTTLRVSYNKATCVLTVILLMELLSPVPQIPAYISRAWASSDFP
jgi:hypothetical protein